VETKPSIGLGDTIAKITKATKIDKLVEFIAGEDNQVKSIPGYDGYFITQFGQVFSSRGRWTEENSNFKELKQTLQNGYPSVSLYKTDNIGRKSGDTMYVHRLLAEAFIPKLEGKTFVNHKDGNKENNALDNLEWVTQQENNLHAFQTGLMTQLKYTKEQHTEILNRYHVKGEKQSEIAREMNVPVSFVNDLISRGRGVRSQGLGDDIEKFLNQPLIKPITEKVKKLLWKNSEDCGCDERKEKLNKLFLYKQPICLTEKEYAYLTEFQKVTTTELSKIEADEISGIWNRIFQTRRFYRPCTCNPKAWQEMIDDLLKVYKTYEQ